VCGKFVGSKGRVLRPGDQRGRRNLQDILHIGGHNRETLCDEEP
jgi:hypothetical protein